MIKLIDLGDRAVSKKIIRKERENYCKDHE